MNDNGHRTAVIASACRTPIGKFLGALAPKTAPELGAIVVREAVSGSDAKGAHILFVPAGEEGRFAGLAGAISGSAVTTVGESDRFAAQGGMITFVHEAGRVRFAINLEAAERERLKFSAQLLRLATHVRRKS